MCLENRLTGKEKDEAIAKLPKTFRVWKYCPRSTNRRPEFQVGKNNNFYDYEGEPALAVRKWYKAGVFPRRRLKIPYEPGYHAFLDKTKAEGIYYTSNIREFEARKTDVREIGEFGKDYGHLKGVVLSHIKPV